jgi:hypothetical protein
LVSLSSVCAAFEIVCTQFKAETSFNGAEVPPFGRCYHLSSSSENSL